MTDSPVSLRKEGQISIITIDDGKANVFSYTMSQALNAALDEVDKKAGAVVIEGREGLYSGGFDLNVMNSTDPNAVRKMIISGAHVALKARDFPRPIVAAVTGHAVAMGAIFNMGLDWRIGAKGNFKHGLSEVRGGIALSVFAVELTRFRINPRFYQEVILQSRLFSPGEAVEVGFLDEVIAPDSLREAALRKAEELAALPNPAYYLSKKRDRAPVTNLVRDTLEADLDAMAADEAELT